MAGRACPTPIPPADPTERARRRSVHASARWEGAAGDAAGCLSACDAERWHWAARDAPPLPPHVVWAAADPVLTEPGAPQPPKLPALLACTARLLAPHVSQRAHGSNAHGVIRPRGGLLLKPCVDVCVCVSAVPHLCVALRKFRSCRQEVVPPAPKDTSRERAVGPTPHINIAMGLRHVQAHRSDQHSSDTVKSVVGDDACGGRAIATHITIGQRRAQVGGASLWLCDLAR